MKYIPTFLFLLALLTAGCADQEKANRIAVTIEPQRYFAEKIAGNRFSINTVIPPGQDPEMYDATPRQMLLFNRCQAYLLAGHLGFEQTWIKNIIDNNPNMKTFDLSLGFNTEGSEAEEHQHQHQHPNTDNRTYIHAGVDPHIWSSIEGAKTIARNTLSALISLDGDGEAFFRSNFDALMKEINETDSIIRSITDTLTRRTFIIYHPALTYFAQEFNLRQLCVETDGKDPTPAQMKELTDAIERYDVKVIFVQPEFDRRSVQQLAQRSSCRLIDVNLTAYDWKKQMLNIAKAFADE